MDFHARDSNKILYNRALVLLVVSGNRYTISLVYGMIYAANIVRMYAEYTRKGVKIRVNMKR